MVLIPTTILTGTSGAFVHIETQTLGSDQASVTFSSIAATYEHLMLFWTARGTDAGNPDLNMRFNGDTGANYDREAVAGVGASPASAPSVGQTSIVSIGSLPGSGAAAGRVASGMIVVPAYRRTTFDKTGFGLLDDIRATGGGNEVVQFTGGIWLNTAAVTSLTLLASTGNLLTGSMFSLYGLASS